MALRGATRSTLLDFGFCFSMTPQPGDEASSLLDHSLQARPAQSARARRQPRASVPFAATVMTPATGCWPGCSCCHVCGFSSRKRARSPCFLGIFLAQVPVTTTESAHARFLSARLAAMRRTLGLFLVGAAAASAATLGAMPVRCLPDVTRPPVARRRATHSTHALGVLVPLETRMQKHSAVWDTTASAPGLAHAELHPTPEPMHPH